MSEEKYALLRTFRSLFEGQRYRHRDASLGDLVASQLYEDLVALNKSTKLLDRVQRHERVVNLRDILIGKPSRRGDGTFGELVPAAIAVTEQGLLVARGPVATIEIGAETKILAKAMIKQIDRVIGDLVKQVTHFRTGGGNPIVSASWALISQTNMSPLKAGSVGQPMANATNILSKRLLKLNRGCWQKPVLHSTNSRSYDLRQQTPRRFRLNGSI